MVSVGAPAGIPRTRSAEIGVTSDLGMTGVPSNLVSHCEAPKAPWQSQDACLAFGRLPHPLRGLAMTEAACCGPAMTAKNFGAGALVWAHSGVCKHCCQKHCPVNHTIRIVKEHANRATKKP